MYTLSATKACLTKAGFGTAALANTFLPGAGGNLRVRLSNVIPVLRPDAPRGTVIPNQYVFLVFQKSSSDAVKTEKKAIAVAIKNLNAEGLIVTSAYVKKGVELMKNVFIYSPTGALTQSQREKVGSCLH